MSETKEYHNVSEGTKLFIKKSLDDRDKNKKNFWLAFGLGVLPFIIGAIVWITNIDKRVTIMEQREEVIIELRQEVKEIRKELVQLNLTLARQGVENGRSE